MQIEKILNNNVVQALDNNVEYIVMGKGLGFQKKVGDLVDKEKIEKTFILENTEIIQQYSERIHSTLFRELHPFWKFQSGDRKLYHNPLLQVLP